MAKKTKDESNSIKLIDMGAFFLALLFVISVITNTQTLVETGIKDAPNSYAVIVGVLAIGYGYYRRKKLSTWNVIAATIFITAATIWLFGLSVS